MMMDDFLSQYEGLLTWDDCDEAIIGVGERCGQEPIVVYDYERLLDVFVGQGMDVEDAAEWIEYNIAGAWIGDQTPLILHRPSE